MCASSRDLPVFVYFAQAGNGGPIKIGSSTNVERRVAGIAHHLPETRLLRVLQRGRFTERALHWLFAKNHHKGMSPRVSASEWYEPVPELLALISDPDPQIPTSGPRARYEPCANSVALFKILDSGRHAWRQFRPFMGHETMHQYAMDHARPSERRARDMERVCGALPVSGWTAIHTARWRAFAESEAA